MKSLFLLFIVCIFSACNTNTMSADLIVTNAKIWTGNPQNPWAEAMAIKDGIILAVGSEKDVLKWKSDSTEVLNVQQRFVTPGFIDSHLHFMTGGLNLSSVHLRDAKTPEEFIERIADFAKTTDDWITGGEWDHEQWGGELPTKAWIDKFTKDVPVFVQRLDGHMGLANSKALQLAGIDKNTKDVEGGEIVRNDQGEPTGILKDNAIGLVAKAIPPPTDEQLAKGLQAAMHYVASKGVTSVHQMAGDQPQHTLEAFENARKNNELITRIYVLTPIAKWHDLKEKIEKEGNGDEWVKYGGLKGFVDGSLGSHTAAFKAPYTDAPNDKGIFVNPKDSLEHWVIEGDKAGLQVAVHAIGDDAITFILDTYQKAEKENGSRDRRFRIEHAQHIDPIDYPRFAQLGVIASMQPYHAIDDGRWAERVIGPERIKSTYAFHSLLENNAILAFGSDWYVAPPDPLYGIYAAITRRTLDGANPNGWVPEQKISVEDALKAYTVNAAYASFDEKIKGSLEPGKLADFVVLSENIFEVTPEHIKDVKVTQTFVNGQKVYELK